MGKGEEIHDGEEWSTRKEGRARFPRSFSLCQRGSASSVCVLGCSHYFMTSLALFSLSRPPRPHPHPRPHISLSPSPRPPRRPFSPAPPDIISFHRALPSASLSPPGHSRLTPNNTRFGHKSRTCPPTRQSAFVTRTITRASAPPIACSIGNGLDRVASHSPARQTSPSLPPFSTSPQVRRPPRSTGTYSTAKHAYNTHRSDRSSAYMKRESSPSLFSFSSRTTDVLMET